MKVDSALNDGQIRDIVRSYLEVLEGGGDGFIWGPQTLLFHSRELIAEALLAALGRWPEDSDSEKWLRGFVDLECFLDEKDWSLVEEFDRRAGEGPEAILSMDKERMQAANGITREISYRKISRMELLHERSLFPANGEI